MGMHVEEDMASSG